MEATPFNRFDPNEEHYDLIVQSGFTAFAPSARRMSYRYWTKGHAMPLVSVSMNLIEDFYENYIILIGRAFQGERLRTVTVWPDDRRDYYIGNLPNQPARKTATLKSIDLANAFITRYR